MAAVWAGVDTRLDRPIAVKVVDGSELDAGQLPMLDEEARTVARLAHPNIVALYDVGDEDGSPYLVMELVTGEDLRRRLARGPMEVASAVAVARQVCAALDAAHRAGVVHRDIKPDNVLLTPDGTAKVCDFGIARLQRASGGPGFGGPRSHGPGGAVGLGGGAGGPEVTVGTSEYMAPEQATGGEVDARTDLYALGCLLYAMLTGAPPFTGPDPRSVLWQQVYQPAAPVSAHRSDVPAELDALVARLLAKDPAARPGSAGEVGAALALISDGSAPAGDDAESAGGGVAATAGGSPARARAAVGMTRTRTMPVIDVPAETPPQETGFRLGVGGVAAVAVAAAAITALVVALVMAATSDSPVTAPPGSAANATATPPATAPPAEATVDGLRQVILAQVGSGELSLDDARNLVARAAEIERRLEREQYGRAADRLDRLRDVLREFRDEGRLTDAGYAAITDVVDRLVASLPEGNEGPGRGRGNDDDE